MAPNNSMDHEARFHSSTLKTLLTQPNFSCVNRRIMGVYLIIIPVGFLTGWLIGVLYRPLPRSLLLLHHAVSSNATAHVVTTTTAKITITNLIVTAIPGLIAVTTLIMVLIGVLLRHHHQRCIEGSPKLHPTHASLGPRLSHTLWVLLF